ncbi:MAG: hypothetical protein NC038_03245 [Paludibacter sp.]|nr:hypothetical protein [Bacteroidales bacterium]MCM1069114.1 hypothetical protein [Prevotella sp.]MCM1353553.1 hypothetical protein [Bacteroides sp.]MCM1442714.1 hypothetical protein [Muribaculum sp.]MCM1481650.1 hypothetical protein [Paludibacter sp.]
MKRWYLVIGVLILAFGLTADDFLDDVYYLPELAVQKAMQESITTPYYNSKKIREIVFITDDTLVVSVVDTIAIAAPDYIEIRHADDGMSDETK